MVGNKSVENLAEREGFPACEYADRTLCCWEAHSTLCYTAPGWKGKSDVRRQGMEPLHLRSGPSWTNRTNERLQSGLLSERNCTRSHDAVDSRQRDNLALLRTPGHLDAYGDLVFYWEGQERGRINLEIGQRGGNGSRDSYFISLPHDLESDLTVMSGLAGELDFQIGLDGCRCGGRLWQPRADGDHWKFRSARDLDHVQVAVAIAGIEGLYGDCDQEVALSVVANAFAAGGVALAVGLVQRMRDVVGQGALLEDPLVVRCEKVGSGSSRNSSRNFLFMVLQRGTVL